MYAKSSCLAVSVLLGGAIGALIGIGFAFLLDYGDRSIKSSREAEEIFGYPLQGVIPDLSLLEVPINRRSLLSSPDRYFAPLEADEAYQILQANLKILSTDWNHKAIAVTSSLPQEGKSRVAINLAKSMAQLGKTILLIDADLRRPTQHHILNLNNSVGLSDVLLGEARWEQVVQPVMPNFDILTAGTIPENPVSLLNSQQMKNLTRITTQRYDCIILDTPPLIGMADTLVVGRIVDGFLLVVRPGVVDRESAATVKKLLNNVEQHVLGIVANGVKPKDEPYSKRYFEHH